jgi:hypothetical protein
MAVEIEIAGRELAVRFTGLDRLWSLSGGIAVPLPAVTGARALSRTEAVADKPRVRAPGTFWPGVVVAGSYRWPGRRTELWCVHRGEELLAISLTGQPYARVVVEVPDPGAAARAIEIARTNATP